MGKQWTVESPNRDYTGVRNTDFGMVKFKKGVAKTNRSQAVYLTKLGYFCKELNKPRPEQKPDELVLLQTENEELKKEVSDLSEVKQGCLDQIADLQQKLKNAEAKIAELETKLNEA